VNSVQVKREDEHTAEEDFVGSDSVIVNKNKVWLSSNFGGKEETKQSRCLCTAKEEEN